MKFRLLFLALLVTGMTAVTAPSAQAQNKPSNGDIAAARADITTYHDIAYTTNAGKNQKLDLYIPKNVKHPALVVMIHGGQYLFGDKKDEPISMFLDAGFAVASANYRLSWESIFPAQIIDCKSAVRWLRANAAKYGYDTKRFGAYGESSGGHLVALLGTCADTTKFDIGDNLSVSSRVQVVGDFYGPTDFLQMDANRLPGGWEANKPDSPASKVIGGSIQENKEKTESANPIIYITKNAPPFYIAHGDRDMMVPYNQSVLLANALKKDGIPVYFRTVPNGPHAFNDATANEQVVKFFTYYIGQKK
jgi:acetyl esterase/lipase